MATIPYTFISGTINGFTFYVVNGRQLVRSKTSINQQRFFADPAFAKQRQYSEWLKIASPVASAIYRQLTPQKGLQQRITGHLIQLLKQGLSLQEAAQQLAALLGLQVLPLHLQIAFKNKDVLTQHNLMDGNTALVVATHWKLSCK
ncbi:hypothetical protein [Hydrotalea sandarakina]|jgi:hypothetical protein|uniref:Uncharacterized protein n=1 Tax=Hydrotalea sandarakina TaxID=1004304 RepID=A0A2W7RZD4_9BACT|nr:hypothetical protein [Hydrotalea sandarakina]PZX59999.1 hypothetical protein LX80_02718 [Hydrotalea sandarakina]